MSGRIDLLLTPLLYLILSAVIGIAVGGTIYFKGLSLISITLAFPIAQSAMPLMTFGAAVLFLEEPITWSFTLGTVLVLGGIYLIITPQAKKPASSSRDVTLRKEGWAFPYPARRRFMGDFHFSSQSGSSADEPDPGQCHSAAGCLPAYYHFSPDANPESAINQATIPRHLFGGIRRAFSLRSRRDSFPLGHPDRRGR